MYPLFFCLNVKVLLKCRISVVFSFLCFTFVSNIKSKQNEKLLNLHFRGLNFNRRLFYVLCINFNF